MDHDGIAPPGARKEPEREPATAVIVPSTPVTAVPDTAGTATAVARLLPRCHVLANLVKDGWLNMSR
jgi:hypothetical protein